MDSMAFDSCRKEKMAKVEFISTAFRAYFYKIVS
jgi:hypothetical protein